jgi:hypothetical protein
MLGPRRTAFILALTTTAPAIALADDAADDHQPASSIVQPTVRPRPQPPPPPPPPAKQTDIDQRLAFLDDRIATQHLHAQLWWESWISFYGVGVIVQGARAIEATTAADRADLVVSVVKATGGVVRYAVDPMKGIQSFESVPGESKEARLARGERILAENADATTPFGPWYAHLINLGINGTGAVIVGAGFDDWKQGLISAGIGFAVGEVSLFTQPWEADGDLEEYEARFKRGGSQRAQSVKWTIVPSAGGMGVHASF